MQDLRISGIAFHSVVKKFGSHRIDLWKMLLANAVENTKIRFLGRALILTLMDGFSENNCIFGKARFLLLKVRFSRFIKGKLKNRHRSLE